jgi:hypothetical protein
MRWLTLAEANRRRQARQMCCNAASFQVGSCPQVIDPDPAN